MLPVPFEEPVAPPPAVAVNETFVRAAGKTSVTVAPVTALGPALATTMVYVAGPPAASVVVPLVLVICRSASAPPRVVVIAAALLAVMLSEVPPVAAIRAVLAMLPVADAEARATTV